VAFNPILINSMPRLFSILAAGIMGLAAPVFAAPDLQSLIDRSPFAPPKDEATGESPTEQGALEFRGMVMEGGETTFSVFDATANKARWLRVGEGDSFKVKHFDAGTNQLEVEQQGKSLKLLLKRSTIQAGAPVVAAPQAGGPPNVHPSDPANDTRRLETVAAEVRRRRALRSTPTPAQVPAPAAPNQTP
jgi:hypothetical protein